MICIYHMISCWHCCFKLWINFKYTIPYVSQVSIFFYLQTLYSMSFLFFMPKPGFGLLFRLLLSFSKAVNNRKIQSTIQNTMTTETVWIVMSVKITPKSLFYFISLSNPNPNLIKSKSTCNQLWKTLGPALPLGNWSDCLRWPDSLLNVFSLIPRKFTSTEGQKCESHVICPETSN